ncbi:alpha/beta hydrolase [Rhizobium sp. CECT 9324]|jgi:acetyl esterase|uniref:alpha/beta hydrolase fold domain-containing protein n=1 Tax=Rhizobium sp. CECT 9324 TaxID=2845820 RepID=UPI000DE0E90D|nr:alpha/beta hydrolase [Rhizobium sp. CECT 9324]CAH0339175.1 Carboxylesterase NlhH [Rhizobium sp. CECT 9324]
MKAQWENIALNGPSASPLSVRIYQGASVTKSSPLVLYLRGGAFLGSELDDRERPVARALADTGAFVVEADYSRQSRNAFPHVLDCAFNALNCLNSRRKKSGYGKSLLLVVGEEAGGNVAAGVALKARDLIPGELDGQILLSPMIDPLMTTASFREADRIGMRQRWSDGWSRYLSLAGNFSHPYAALCQCTRLAGVAPALVLTADNDPLRDEAIAYATRLKKAGVPVTRHSFPASSGWTGIYGDESGDWLKPLCRQFEDFVADLKH